MATAENGATNAYRRLVEDAHLLVLLIPAEVKCEDEPEHVTDHVTAAMLDVLYDRDDYKILSPTHEPELYRAAYSLALAQMPRIANAKAEDPETFTLSVRAMNAASSRRLVRHVRLVQLSRERSARPRSAVRRATYTH